VLAANNYIFSYLERGKSGKLPDLLTAHRGIIAEMHFLKPLDMSEDEKLCVY
jgi:hypothetical protein